jgi:hypothetical protein
LNPAALGAAGLFILAIGETPNYFAGLLPSWMTIRRFAGDERDVSTLRTGLVVGSVFSLVVGVGTALIAGTVWPLIGVMAGVLFLVVGYRWAINHPHDDAAPINAPANLKRIK